MEKECAVCAAIPKTAIACINCLKDKIKDQGEIIFQLAYDNEGLKDQAERIEKLQHEKQVLSDAYDDQDKLILMLTQLLSGVDKDYTPSEDWFDKRKELIG